MRSRAKERYGPQDGSSFAGVVGFGSRFGSLFGLAEIFPSLVLADLLKLFTVETRVDNTKEKSSRWTKRIMMRITRKRTCVLRFFEKDRKKTIITESYLIG